jgi:hypothetical protein
MTETSFYLDPGLCNNTTPIKARPNGFDSSDSLLSKIGFGFVYCDLEFICDLGFVIWDLNN